MPKDFPVTWQDIHLTAKALAWKVEEKGPFKGVVGITRGGMVPATIVACELNIKMLETLCISSYDFHTHQQIEPTIIKAPDIGDGEGWLIVDDLVDTGRTFEIARKMYPKALYIALYAKPQGKPMTDVFMTEVSQDTWIYLPWDDLSFPPHIHEQIGQYLNSLKDK